MVVRLRTVSAIVGVAVAVAVLAAASVAGLVWRGRSGRVRVDHAVVPAGLAPSGADVTLLQFSSERCAPCRRVRAICADVAGDLAGVRHVEVDVDMHLDAVRALDVWRLPTLLVVDRAGRVARRTVGVPARADLVAAVEQVLTERTAA
jgi:thiol-disulfide isomerase/thioredoxin